MFGYNPKYFNTNFLNSFRSAVNESLTKSGNHSGVGISTEIQEQNREPGRSVGQISDLELQRRMRETKRTSIFGAQKQTAEYLELEKEAQRRAGAAKTPAAPTAGAPAAKPAAPVAKPVAPAVTPKTTTGKPLFAPEAPKTDGLKTSGKSTAMPFDEPSSPAATAPAGVSPKPTTIPGVKEGNPAGSGPDERAIQPNTAASTPAAKPSTPTVRPDMSAVPGAKDRIAKFNPMNLARGVADIALNAARANAEKTRSGEGIMGAPMFSGEVTSRVQIPQGMVRKPGSAPVASPNTPGERGIGAVVPSRGSLGQEAIQKQVASTAARRQATLLNRAKQEKLNTSWWGF